MPRGARTQSDLCAAVEKLARNQRSLERRLRETRAQVRALREPPPIDLPSGFSWTPLLPTGTVAAAPPPSAATSGSALGRARLFFSRLFGRNQCRS